MEQEGPRNRERERVKYRINGNKRTINARDDDGLKVHVLEILFTRLSASLFIQQF